MKKGLAIRNYTSADADAVNRVALEAFAEYEEAYSDWPAFSRVIGNMSALAANGELIVATRDDRIVGAVAYIGPGIEKSSFFDRDWSIIRMLVVTPSSQGQGIGRALTDECVCRARRDASPVIALHTSPLMKAALTLYARMGFEWVEKAPDIYGVPYGIYLKRL